MRVPFLFLLLASAAPAPLLAQEVETPTDEADLLEEELYEEEDEPIVVTGQRERGAVIGDIPPEIQFNAREIRSLGAGSIAELLEAIEPQTRSGRGRGEGGPVLLLNGRRISGFSEIRGIPPEAIVRIDVLPEEVALKYGYRADQRVVNFVLRERFRAVTAEVEYGAATAGGRSLYEAEANLLRITNQGRLSFDIEVERQSPLFEAERDVVQAASGAPLIEDPDGGPADLRPFRTLLGENDQMSFGATLNRTILGNVSATLNGRFEASQGMSFLGLPSGTLAVPADSPFAPSPDDLLLGGFVAPAGPLTRSTESRTGHIGLALNGDVGRWRWSLTGNADRVRNSSRTDAGIDLSAAQALLDAGDPSLDPFAPLPPALIAVLPSDRSRSVTHSADAELVANGNLLRLPAGAVSATFKLGADTRGLDSETLRAGVEQSRDLSRDRLAAQGSLDVPIASRRREVLGAIGDLSANLNAAVENLSDFGTLATIGYGLNWSPIPELDLIASVTDEDGAPSIQQLGDPVVVTPNVRVFDLVRGETVDITRIDGGNPDLLADDRRVLKLGLTLKPLSETDLTLTANYTDSRTLNPIASFPAATPEIEAAFPDRFLRDASGRLIRIDNRPVNFARAGREQLRWGINFSKRLGPQPTEAERDARREARRERRQERGAAGERRGSGGRGFGGRGFGGGGRGGRLQLAFYHSWRLEDSILIRPGVPELDLLDGSAVGARGGEPRHEIEFRASLFKDGFGARLSADWRQGSFVRGALDGSGDGDLFFDDLTTLDLRLFANLGQQRGLVRDHPFLRGSRITLSIDNVFDSRPDVRDAAGLVPLGYQAAYLDPLGRTVSLSFRKLFF